MTTADRLITMQPTILLIESEPMRVQRLYAALSRGGFDLRLISDPENAVQAARDIRPSKILIGGSIQDQNPRISVSQ